MKKTIISLLILAATSAFFIFPKTPKASAHTNLPQRYPWIKTYANDYNGNNDNRIEEFKFQADHYDLVFQGYRDLSQYTTDGHGNIVPGGPHPLQIINVDYKFLTISSPGPSDDYTDAQNWAASQNPPVDFETFFLHYSEPTTACFSSTCYSLPAGSRIPYGSFPTTLINGLPDFTSKGTKLQINPNNTGFIAWKLDRFARTIGANSSKSFVDGMQTPVKPFNEVPSRPTISQDSGGNYLGGHISEYSGTPGITLPQYYTEIGEQWYTAWIDKLFKGFKNHPQLGQAGKLQIISTGTVKDYDYVNNKPLFSKFYPYIWGINRADQDYNLDFSPRNIYDMKQYGIYDIDGQQGWVNADYHYKNFGDYDPPIYTFSCSSLADCALHHSIDNPEDSIEADPNYENGQRELERFAEANLSMYYMIKDDHTIFFPMQPNRDDAWGRGIGMYRGEWMKSTEFNIGQPKPNQGNSSTPWNQFTVTQGDDPSSGKTTSLSISDVTTLDDPDVLTNPYNWEVKDDNPTVQWKDGEWNGWRTPYPYYEIRHSGYNSNGNYNYAIFETYYGHNDIPTIGTTYQIGHARVDKYNLYMREYDKALVFYKTSTSGNESDPSRTTHQLPKTADNPSGVYYRLGGMNGMDTNLIDPSKPLTSIDLRNNEGMILIKASALATPEVTLSADKSNVRSGDTITYSIQYTNYITDAKSARIEDLIPFGMTYIDGSASNSGSFDGTKVIWNLGDLSPGTRTTVTFQVRVN